MSSSLEKISKKISRVRELPPRVVLAKVIERLTDLPRREVERLRVSWSPSELTDADLAAALADTRKGTALAGSGEGTLPFFPVDLHERESYCRVALSLWPTAEEETLAQADEICQHTFDLLGSGKVSLGPEIDWQRDFKSGFRWPKQFYRDIVRIRMDDDSDIKVTRELSRCQHFTTLGKAYWYGGDETYAREFRDQVLHWIEDNPVMRSVNWDCTMDVAIRAVNWLWGYAFFQSSPALDESFRARFMKSLLSHGRFIRKNLESSQIWRNGQSLRASGNHYLADLVGLLFLGVLLPELREAREWRVFATEELWQEAVAQVYEDGVVYESSISYHRLSTEFLLTAILLCQRNGVEVPSAVLDWLSKMLEFVRFYTRPDGLAPQVGDADDGRLQILGPQRIDDHRYLLTVGAILLDRPEFKEAVGEFHEEALWLLGPGALEQWKALPDGSKVGCGSKGFPQAGMYTMRHRDLYLFCDCGAVGIHGYGSHEHSDPLSIEVYAHDKAFIVDPGSYVYSASPKWRNHFRSTAWHNTLQVDGEEANRFDPEQLFAIQNDARPEVMTWESTQTRDYLDARHSGYSRLEDPVIHRRRICFEKQHSRWVIRDDVLGISEHLLEWFFHFDSGLPVKLVEENRVVTICGEGANLALEVRSPSPISLELREGWVSRRYGVKETAWTLRATLRKKLPFNVFFLLIPFGPGEKPSFESLEIPELLRMN